MIAKLTELFILVVPTLLFVLIMIGYVTVGYNRGLHKSKVMLINSLIIGAIMVGLYLLLVNNAYIDELLVSIVNLFMGEGGLQSAMGVSATCKTLREILIEYIPQMAGYGNGIDVILKDNGAYLGALVNLVYHIIFAIIFFVLYLLNLFIVNLVRSIFFSERRFMKRQNKLFINYRAESTYQKGRWKGAFIGFFRGLVSCTIIFSMLGGSLYAITGGKGENKYEELSFGDPTADQFLNIYKSLDKYGTHGIFKVLNSIKDPNDVPYYLYVADLIFQGNYNEKLEDGSKESQSVVLRKEVATYTKFSKDTLQLVMKYGGQPIKDIILGKTNDEQQIMDVVMDVIQNSDFQSEFTRLFNHFDDNSYVMNLAFSLVNSIVANIDSVSFGEQLDADTKEIIKIIFKDGYLSETIPYEAEMLSNNSKTKLPCLKVKNIINRHDISIILDIVLDALADNGEDIVKTVTDTVYNVSRLSLFSGHTKKDINPVIARLYAFIETKYLGEPDADIIELADIPGVKTYHDFLYYNEVDWIGEFQYLVDSITGVTILSENLYDPNAAFLDILLNLFDKNYPTYRTNIAVYNDLKLFIDNSKIIGRILSSKFINAMIEDGLSSVNENIVIPSDISYNNVYDKDGHFVRQGELSALLNIIEYFADSNNRPLFDKIMNAETFDYNLVKELTSKLDDYQNDFKISDCIGESSILRALLSSLFIGNDETETFLYIPESALDVDSENHPINCIKRSEFKELINNLDNIVGVIEPIINNPEDINNVDILLRDPRLNSIVDNSIVQGTIAANLLNFINDNPDISIPESLATPDDWIKTSKKESEVVKVLHSFNLLDSLKISDIANGTIDPMQLISDIQVMANDDVYSFFDSELLRYIISDFIRDSNNFSDFTIVVPNAVVEDDSIKAKTLADLIIALKYINFDEIAAGNIDNLMVQLIKNEALLDNEIMFTTLVYNMVDNFPNANETVSSALQKDAELNSLIEFKPNNKWRKELPALVKTLRVLIKDDTNFNFENLLNNIDDELLANYDSIIDGEHTFLEVLYDSEIIVGNVSKYIDELTATFVTDGADAVTKNDSGLYKINELHSLLLLMDAINIKDFNSFEGTNLFEEIKKNISNPMINKAINESYLIRSIVTKEVSNYISPFGLASHEKAFDKYKILHASEVTSLLEILSDINIEDFRFDEVNVSNFKKYLYDEETKDAKSYLLVATVSKYILELAETDNFVIPRRSLESSSRNIKPLELFNLINSLEALQGNNSLIVKDINLSQFTLLFEDRETLIKSDIVNATICKNLKINGLSVKFVDRNDPFASKSQAGYILSERDYRGNKISLFTQKEFNSILYTLFQLGLDKLNGNTITFDSIVTLSIKLASNFDLVFRSTSIHILISDLIKEKLGDVPFVTYDNVNYYDALGNRHSEKVISKASIKQIITGR